MSYEKAMKHHRNLRKCKKQGNMYFGFDVSTERTPASRANPYIEAIINIREWFKDRHRGDAKYNRECVREQIEIYRSLRAEKYSVQIP